MEDYRIKQKPEDFIVRERSSFRHVLNPEKEGPYSYFLMKKTNFNTMDAIEKISSFLKIPLKDIGFAGTKDKIAVTEQYISIKGGFESRLKDFKAENLELKFIGKGDSPISLGDLEGNEFEITIRDAKKEPKKLSRFINYFGEQRFGSSNAETGKSIIKGDFRKACENVKDRRVDAYLQDKPNDFAGALKQLPKKILTLYINAYQSKLWNTAVSEYIKGKGKAKFFPLLGFGTEFDDETIEKIYQKMMKDEKITERDFIIRKLPELSSEGSEREIFTDIKGLKIEKMDKTTYRLSFSLSKGCYATEAVRQMMG